jgi:hypothetical protein
MRQKPGKDHGRDVIRLEGSKARASVDVQTGLLMRFFRPTEEVEAGEPRITLEEGKKTAEAFLARIGVPLQASWTLVQSRFFDHGTAGRKYEFEWKKFVRGVRLPAYLEVSVDADSGLVSYYYLLDDAVVVPITSRLTAAQAVELVARRARVGAPVVDDARPVIWYYPEYPGTQAVFWEVQLRDSRSGGAPGSTVIGRVHAQTGEVVSVVRAPGSPAERTRAGKGEAVAVKPPALPKVDLEGARETKVPRTAFQLAKRKS